MIRLLKQAHSRAENTVTVHVAHGRDIPAKAAHEGCMAVLPGKGVA